MPADAPDGSEAGVPAGVGDGDPDLPVGVTDDVGVLDAEAPSELVEVGVHVCDDDGVRVRDDEGVAVCDEDGVRVRDDDGV